MFTRGAAVAKANAGLSVWILFPAKNANPAEFAALLRELLRHQFPFPWFHRLRLIVREDPAAPVVHAGISQTAKAGSPSKCM